MTNGVRRGRRLNQSAPTPIAARRWYRVMLPLSASIVAISGSIKATPLGALFPVDLTFLGVLLIVILALVKGLHASYPLRRMAPLLVFFAYYLAHLLVIPESGQYASEQYLKFILLTVPLLLAFAMLVTSVEELELVNRSWLISASCVVALSLVVPTGETSTANQRVALGDSAGSLGYWAATGFVVCLARLAYGELTRTAWLRWFVVLLGAAVFLFFTIASASRGAVLGVLTACILLFAIAPNRSRWRLVLALAPGFILALSILRSLPTLAQERFSVDDQLRSYALRSAWTVFVERPWFGGGASAIEAAVYPLDYSHNLLMDVLAGQGVMGLILFLWIVGSAVKAIYSNRKLPAVGVLAGLLAMYFAGAMVSLDINNRLLWLTLVAGLTLPFYLDTGNRRDSSQRSPRIVGTRGTFRLDR